MNSFGAFPDKAVIAEQTARMLLEVEAVRINAKEPFTLTSGRKSPVYLDCRLLISYPRVRQTLIDFGVSTILREVGYETFDSVAGGETAGIAFAAWVADRMMLPMEYVRKKPKGFGRNAQIEGYLEPGQRVLLVEDMTTDGGSKIVFCDALRKAGAKVEHVLVFFYYDIFKDAPKVFEEAGLSLHYLATWWDVLKVAEKGGQFDAATLEAMRDFFNDPVGWSDANGGAVAASG